MAIKYLDTLRIRQVDSDGVPEIHQLKLRSGALDIADINSNISVAWANVSSKPTTATRWPTWSEVTSKPSTFAPSSHTHAWTEITDKPTTATRWPAWSEVTSKPSTFAPSSHSHAWTEITGKPANSQFPVSSQSIGASQNLNNYTTPGYYYQNSNANAGNGSNYPVAQAGTLVVTRDAGTTQMYYHYNGNGMYYRTLYNSTWTPWRTIYHTGNIPTTATRWPAWSEVTGKPSTFAPSSHTHTWAQVTGKPSSSTTRILSLRTASANTTYTLTQSIANFDMIIVYAIVFWSSSTAYNVVPTALTPSADQTPGGAVYTATYNLGSTPRSMTFWFASATTIKVGSVAGSSGPRIYVEGIKYGL